MAGIDVSTIDPAKIEQFIEDSERSDPDFYFMRVSMLRHGCSPWKAAKRAEKGSRRSFSTLLYHAKDIAREIHEVLGTSNMDILKDFLENDEVHVEESRANEIIRSLRESGFTLVRDVRLRAVDADGNLLKGLRLPPSRRGQR